MLANISSALTDRRVLMTAEPASLPAPSTLREPATNDNLSEYPEERADHGRYVRPAFVPGPADEALWQALTRPHAIADSVATHFARIERAVATVICSQPAHTCRALLRRLINPHPDDHVAERMARLVGDRRQRIMRLLADAPRRAALQRVDTTAW